MKKLLAALLSVLMLFSCLAVTAFAEDGAEITDPVYVTVIYKAVDEANNLIEITLEPKMVQKGAEITSAEMEQWLYDMPRQFVDEYIVTEDGYSRTEERTYTFRAFTKEGDDSGKLYYFGSTGPIDDNTTFVAQYEIEDTIDYTTFWELVQSIFARINLIFEYFAEIFGF